MARLQDFQTVIPSAANDNLLIVQAAGQGLAKIDSVGQKIANDTTISSLNTTSKKIVGAINENKQAIGTKAEKTQITDYVKLKHFTLFAADVTRNMDLSSNVSLDSGYKFLCYMPSIVPDGFTTDQYLWLSAPNSIPGRPWWNTNPIVGAGTGTKLRFYYLEIKDIT